MHNIHQCKTDGGGQAMVSFSDSALQSRC